MGSHLLLGDQPEVTWGHNGVTWGHMGSHLLLGDQPEVTWGHNGVTWGHMGSHGAASRHLLLGDQPEVTWGHNGVTWGHMGSHLLLGDQPEAAAALGRRGEAQTRLALRAQHRRLPERMEVAHLPY
eukprot:6797707-Prymnesium_polylepis.2